MRTSLLALFLTSACTVDPSTDDTDTPELAPLKIGLIADLSGPFGPLIQPMVEVEQAYWDLVNETGGVAGHPIELLVEDSGYDVTAHVAAYDAMREDVVAIGHSTGSPQSLAIAESAAADEMTVIPLSWWSGWPMAELRPFLPLGSSYCYEAMNSVDWASEKHRTETTEAPTWAILSYAGDYGQDGATGAKLALDALGLELVYDGEAAVSFGSDPTPVIEALVASEADWVYLVVAPGDTAALVGEAAAQGFTGRWIGSAPAYNSALLGVPGLGAVLDASYWSGAFHQPWGATSTGASALEAAVGERLPELEPHDLLSRAWAEASLLHQALNAAAFAGDLTPKGVLEAARSLDPATFGGLSPDQGYAAEPADAVLRQTLILKPTLANYQPGTVSDGASTGSVVVQDFFVSETAANHTSSGACWPPAGR